MHLILTMFAVYYIGALIGTVALDNIPRGVGVVREKTCPQSKDSRGDDKCVPFMNEGEQFGWPLRTRYSLRESGVKYGLYENKPDFFDKSILNSANSFFAIAVLSLILVVANYRGLLRPKRYYDAPVLSANGFFEGGKLVPLNKGTIGGNPYAFMTNASGKVILHITLAKKSALHMAVFGTKSRSMADGLLPSKFLAEVTLEGDFPKDFNLYATPHMQIELLTLLDPATMAYLSDFCKTYEIELFLDSLYISVNENVEDTGDTTTMVVDAEKLLQKINKVLKI